MAVEPHAQSACSGRLPRLSLYKERRCADELSRRRALYGTGWSTGSTCPAVGFQELLVVRENHETGERSLDLLKWELIPFWTKDAKNRSKPINAMAETVRSKPMFLEAYRKRRCIVPVDGFFEWQATKAGKQPYPIGMKDGAPFGLTGLWENWRDPAADEWVRRFTIITVPSNEMIARIHDRMPAILRPADYERWLGADPDDRTIS